MTFGKSGIVVLYSKYSGGRDRGRYISSLHDFESSMVYIVSFCLTFQITKSISFKKPGI